MKYKFLEHTADVMFEAYGQTLEELFVNSALATFDVMVDLKKVQQKYDYRISLEKRENYEVLLFDWIAELIFLKDSEHVVFSNFDVYIKEKNGKYSLYGIVWGDEIQPNNQKIDVKAVTMHKFLVRKEQDAWKARIVLDI